MKSLNLLLLTFALLGLSAGTNAQIARYVPGTHYQVLDTPVRTADSSKIEVVELFWYGCPACYALEPLIANWERSAASDVDHKRLPAAWNPITEIHAQAFFAAQSLDALDAVHDRFFEEFHQNRNRLHNEVVIREFFESCGISAEDFDRVFNSFSVRTRVQQAKAQMKDYGRAQTPSLYVNGKYIVTLSNGGYQEMLDIVDFLVEIERG